MIEFLVEGRPLIGREGAADLAEHLGRGDRGGPALGVGQQLRQRGTPMGVGDRTAQGACWATLRLGL